MLRVNMWYKPIMSGGMKKLLIVILISVFSACSETKTVVSEQHPDIALNKQHIPPPILHDDFPDEEPKDESEPDEEPKTEDVPNEEPKNEVPIDQPTEIPAEKPVETPAENPKTEPGKKPIITLDPAPIQPEKPAEKPIEKPVIKPKENPKPRPRVFPTAPPPKKLRQPSPPATADVLDRPLPRVWIPNDLSLDTNLKELNYKSRKHDFLIQGSSLETIQIIKNCFDYLFCKEYDELPISTREVHVHINLDSNELKKFFNSCNLDSFDGSIQLTDMVTKNEIDLPELQTLKQINYGETAFAASIPAVVTPIDLKKTESIKKQIQNFLDLKKYQDALNLVLSEFKLNFDGYTIKFNNPNPRKAVTSQKTKSINFGESYLTYACDFFLAVRHEAEHVQQVIHAEACNPGMQFARDLDKLSNSSLIYRIPMEHAAYMNDILNMGLFCPEDHVFTKLNSFEMLLKYITGKYKDD